MRSNIDQARTTVAQHPNTESVDLDGDTSDVILRAMVDEFTDDFESFVEDRVGASITSVHNTPFGVELEMR